MKARSNSLIHIPTWGWPAKLFCRHVILGLLLPGVLRHNSGRKDISPLGGMILKLQSPAVEVAKLYRNTHQLYCSVCYNFVRGFRSYILEVAFWSTTRSL